MNFKSIKVSLFVTLAIGFLAGCGSTKSTVKQENKPASQTVPQEESTPDLSMLPKKDFRAVWVATIGGIDWPRERFDEVSQKAWYNQILDSLQKLNINTVFFQIRPKADAFYDSPYEPWSEYITGYKGKAPSYDVLRWLIDQTHERGMSFHAWMNPYRVGTRKTTRGHFDPLDPKIPKKLIKDYRLVRIYNPAMPETRQRLCAIVKDLLQKYNVDGIHFDDYFYPALAKGEKMNDNAEYRKYGKGYSSIEDFRRAMVDSLVKMVHDTIRSVRPSVVFSISPQGNYHNNYHDMYANIALWSAKGWCDVIIPQLYWSTEKYFLPRLKWFSENASDKTHLMIGYGLYRYNEKAKDPFYRKADDLALQMSEAYKDKNVSGAALYSAIWLINNPVNINATIASQFNTIALPPYLGQEPEQIPDKPNGVKSNGMTISWQPKDNCYYAIYKNNGAGREATLIAVTIKSEYTVNGKGNYFVTSVIKGNNAQSAPSDIVEIK